jgi:hypothetical protein
MSFSENLIIVVMKGPVRSQKEKRTRPSAAPATRQSQHLLGHPYSLGGIVWSSPFPTHSIQHASSDGEYGDDIVD